MIKGTTRFEYCKNILQQNPIFRNLEESTLDSLLSGVKFKKWKKGAEFHHHETLNNFHVILSGRLKIYQINPENGRELTVFLLSRHDVFDIISLLDEQKRTTNFKTLDTVELLSAPVDNVKSWIESNPEINKTLLPYLGKRMRMLEENLTDAVLSDIPTRLAKLILKNIDESSKKLQLINDLSNNEIASLIGSTRAVVNRHIQNFKEDGILDVQRKNTQIKNIKKLLEKIEDSL
ncbi:Crp/Fnr family transcriptional regulator [Aquimarina sp. SS2-1]|uniref:Crp/Fnr family transcriptional regulator n=1 Tax=Aquimarina besae TaxID=3342247 RepID=UPI003672B211